jgi:PEP-CTERM motif-containing protein
MRNLYSIALFTTLLTISSVSAAVLTFDIIPPSPLQMTNNGINQAYGQRISAANMGGLQYGLTGGLTPNVTVNYHFPAALSNAPCQFDSNSCVYFWDNNIGDLPNAIAQSASSGPSVGMMLITFTADPGFQVSLGSLDLAGWPNYNPNIVSNKINGVTVLDDQNNVIFHDANPIVPWNIVGPDHLHVAVNSGFFSSLTLQVDASNLEADLGTGWAANLFMDNIQFSQDAAAVPEPATFVLVGAALAALGVLRRRK